MGNGPAKTTDRPRVIKPATVRHADETFARICEHAAKRNPTEVKDALAAYIAKNFTKFGKTITNGNAKNDKVKTDDLVKDLLIDEKTKAQELKEVFAASADKTIKRKDKLDELKVADLAGKLLEKGLVSKERLAEIQLNYQQVTKDDIAAYIRDNKNFTKLGKTMNGGKQIRAFQEEFGATRTSNKWWGVLNFSFESYSKKSNLMEFSIDKIANSYASYNKDKIPGVSRDEFRSAVVDYSTPSEVAKLSDGSEFSNALNESA
jgi:hypothetical protein